MLPTFKRIFAGDDTSLLLRKLASESPKRPYASFASETVDFGSLLGMVDAAAGVLSGMGVSRESRVAIGLGNSVAHSALIFALFKLGAIWVPLNMRLRGAPLHHVLTDSAASHLIAEEGSDFAQTCADVLRLSASANPSNLIGSIAPSGQGFERLGLWALVPNEGAEAVPENIRSIMYTSGTTGPAKGVLVTDLMLRASALGGLEVAGPVDGDVFYLWEPFCHIGGAEVLLFPLLSKVSLAIASGFSASKFWTDVAEAGATHIHHLGGILQMLLSQTPSLAERQHRVRVSWGAGATPDVWYDAERRFGFTVHECYGMTENSSVTTVNRQGHEFGVGFPLPWFEVRIARSDTAGTTSGEVEVRGLYPGLLTPGYLNNEAATTGSRSDDGWFRTGDLGELGDAGNLHFLGRANDSFRVRGENVSAWQVESVFGAHFAIDQCAVLAVAADVGEQELLLLMTAAEGFAIEIDTIAEWARDRLPDFQIPRYMQVVPDFPLTPTRRVAKKEILVDVTNAVDLRPPRRKLQASR